MRARSVHAAGVTKMIAENRARTRESKDERNVIACETRGGFHASSAGLSPAPGVKKKDAGFAPVGTWLRGSVSCCQLSSSPIRSAFLRVRWHLFVAEVARIDRRHLGCGFHRKLAQGFLVPVEMRFFLPPDFAD